MSGAEFSSAPLLINSDFTWNAKAHPQPVGLYFWLAGGKKKFVTWEARGTSIYKGKQIQVDVGKYFARSEK